MLELILSILAVYRLSYLITEEDGSYNIFARLRKLNKHRVINLSCFECMSLWLSAPFSLMFANSILHWLAIAGGAILVYRFSNGL